jgi:hypothetical protein
MAIPTPSAVDGVLPPHMLNAPRFAPLDKKESAAERLGYAIDSLEKAVADIEALVDQLVGQAKQEMQVASGTLGQLGASLPSLFDAIERETGNVVELTNRINAARKRVEDRL